MLNASPSFASEMVGGWGGAVKEAQEVALYNAQQAVIARGKGCIGYADGKNPVQKPKKDGDLWYVEVRISHHNGSCHIDKGIAHDFERETGINGTGMLKMSKNG